MLVIAGGIFISPNFGGPTGAQTAQCGVETVTSGPMGEVRSIVQTGGSGSPAACFPSACTPGLTQASSPLVEKYFDEDGLVNKFNIQRICLKAISARTFGCPSTGISSEANACNPSTALGSGEISIGTFADLYKTNLQNSAWDENVVRLIVQGVGSGSIQTIEWSGSFSPQTTCPSGKLYAGSFHEIHFKEQEFYRKYNICLEPGPPTAPLNLAVTAKFSPLRAAISWNKPTGDGGSPLKNYNIYRRDSLTAAPAKIGTTCTSSPSCLQPETDTNYQDTTVSKGKTYYYTVKAVNNADLEGPASSEVSVTTPDVPGAPTLNPATSGFRKIDLSWSAHASNGGSAVICYKIYRQVNRTDAFALITGTENAGDCANSPAGTTYTDNSMSPGAVSIYGYKVAAMNAVGVGAQSNFYERNIFDVPSAPLSPTAIGGANHVNLSWLPSENYGGGQALCFKVYRSTSQTGMYTTITGTENAGDCANSPAGTTYTDSTASAGTTYYYKVSMMNEFGAGDKSSSASATTLNLPAVISTLAATAGTKKIDLTWTAPSDGGSPILCYKVFRRWLDGQSQNYILISSDPSDPDEFYICQTSDPTTASYTDSTVSEKQTYKYIVAAVNAVGPGSGSNTPQAHVPDATPPTITAASLTNNSANIRIDFPYMIFNFSEPIDTTTINSNTITISPAAQSTASMEPSGKDARIAFNENFTYGKTYTISAGTGVKDTAGNGLSSLYKISFTTVTDASTLIVYGASIANESADVFPDVKGLTIEFNKEISAQTDAAITISPKVNFSKKWSADLKKVNLTFSKPLAYNTNYQITVANTITDIYGFSLTDDYSTIFTTVPVLSVSLADFENNTAGVSIMTSNISLALSRPISTSTDGAITIFPKANFSKYWSEDNKTLSVLLGENLTYSTDYRILVGPSLRDIYGKNITSVQRFLFKTESKPIVTTTTTQPTATTGPPGTGTTTTTTSAGKAGISASEAFVEIQAANLAIKAAEGKKDTSNAREFYIKAVDSYGKADYETAKQLALQAKTSIKDLAPKEELPILYISIAAAILLLLATGGIYIYLKKNQAKATEKKPEAPPTPPPSQARR